MSSDERKILELIRQETGLDFSKYSTQTIKRRLQSRLATNEASTLNQYLQILKRDYIELKALTQTLRIGVTAFFRDNEVFDHFKKKLLKELLKNKKSLRVWVSACSSGEEVYSWLILLENHLAKLKQKIDLQVFATDIDERSIEIARQGKFKAEKIKPIPKSLRDKYFKAQGKHWLINNNIRDKVVFSTHNAIYDPPFSQIDLVSCRNLLIYLQEDIQQRLLANLHYALKPHGLLVLGLAEHMGKSSRFFTEREKRLRIYEKKVNPIPSLPGWQIFEGNKITNEKSTSPEPIQSIDEIVHEHLLEHFTPASVLINEVSEIIYIHGSTSDYLELSSGKMSANILHVAKKNLKLPIIQCIQQIKKEKQQSVTKEISITTKKIKVAITVSRLSSKKLDYLLISFSHKPDIRHRQPNESEKVKALEKELANSEQFLQQSIRDLEKTNRQLQSANEKLKITNEELETSKEELQSANEELVTANNELQRINTELNSAHSDIYNLMRSTEIKIIFLNKKLEIERFTENIKDLFSLRESDLGRHLEEFHLKFAFKNLIPTCKKILKGKRPLIENEIHSTSNRFFLMRLLPYKTESNRIQGVVITFTDITENKKSERIIQESEAEKQKILNSMQSGLYIYDVTLAKNIYINPAYTQITGYTLKDLNNLKTSFMELFHHEDRHAINNHMQKLFQSKQNKSFRIDYRFKTKSGSWRWLASYDTPFERNEKGQVVQFVGSFVDITDRKHFESQLESYQNNLEELVKEQTITLRENEAMLTTILDTYPKGSINVFDENLRYILARGRALEDNGLTSENLIGRSLHDIYDKAIVKYVTPYYQRALKGEEVEFALTFNNSKFLIIARRLPLKHGKKKTIIVVAHDITELEEKEAALREAQRISKVGSWQWSVVNNEVTWSDEMYRIFDVSREDFKSTVEYAISLFHPDDRKSIRQATEKALREKKGRPIEARVLLSDGSIKCVQGNAEMVFDAQEQLMMMRGTYQDITEKKMAEQAIKATEERLLVTNKLLQSISQAQSMLLANETEEEIFSQILSNFCQMVDAKFGLFAKVPFDTPNDGHIVKALFPTKLKMPSRTFFRLNSNSFIQKSLARQTITIENAASRLKTLKLPKKPRSIQNAVIIPLVKDKNHLGFFFLANHDKGFSEEQFAETAPFIDAMALLLDSIINQKRRNVTEEQIVQAEKMIHVGQLASGIAHDINNPLSIVLHSAEALERKLAKIRNKLPEFKKYSAENKIERQLENLTKGGETIRDIVSTMSSYIREGNSDFTRVDIANIFETVQWMLSTNHDLRKALQEKQITIKSKIHASCQTMVCDEVKIRQVLFNMVQNSMQAIIAHGKAKVKYTIALQARKKKNQVELIIKDNGPGISKQVQRNIFDPFFTTKKEQGGTGLGLFITFYVIKQIHSGEIDFTSTNKGTTFHLRIPQNLKRAKK